MNRLLDTIQINEYQWVRYNIFFHEILNYKMLWLHNFWLANMKNFFLYFSCYLKMTFCWKIVLYSTCYLLRQLDNMHKLGHKFQYASPRCGAGDIPLKSVILGCCELASYYKYMSFRQLNVKIRFNEQEINLIWRHVTKYIWHYLLLYLDINEQQGTGIECI